MSQQYRNKSGGQIDRSKVVNFEFDGRRYQGYEGDTLASALLANGVRLFGRSFKYHRPRGLLTAGSDEPNAIVELRERARRKEPNTRITTIELFDGLVANPQNAWPSINFDLMSFVGQFSPLLSAGFYYKTFMWPASFWTNVYEKFIRNAAGLGEASHEADPDEYEHMNEHCDVLVVGAGPAVFRRRAQQQPAAPAWLLCEEQNSLGGSLNSGNLYCRRKPGAEWAAEQAAELGQTR